MALFLFPRRIAAAALAGTLGLLAATSGSAAPQGTVPAQGAAPSAQPLAITAPTGPAGAAPRPAAVSEVSVLRRLPVDPRQMRFEGENATRIFPIYLTGAEANSRARIRLSYTNAVSVMPEASRLTVSINDVLISDAQIVSSAANGPALLDVEVPESVLEPGYNAVRIAIQQRHRVDCSIGATYELWTQFDPALSGIAFTGNPPETIMDLAELPALAAGPDGSRPMRVVVPKGTGVDGLSRILRAMEAVILRGRFAHPAIEIATEPSDEPGLDLLVGTTDELRQAGFGPLVSDDTPIAFRPGTRVGQSTLVISGLGVPELETAIGDIVRGNDQAPAGTVVGLRALTIAAGTRIRSERTLTLKDLGVATEEFSGRLFRAGFDVIMPPDFYAADYGKVTLRINAGYVAGLDPSSQILVRVNERDAASLALRNPNGDVFRDHPITVSLADLRPGFNHVQIEAQVPTPADKACDVQSVIDAKKRFVLLDDSVLEMPSVARIAHMPSLSATAASGFPYVSAGANPQLFLPHPDKDTITATAAFLARAAWAAGMPLEINLVVAKPQIDDTSAIVIGGVGDIPTAILGAVGLDPSRTRDVWSNIEARSEAMARLDRAKEQASAKAVGRPVQRPAGDDRDQADVYQKWSANVSSTQWHIDPIGWIGDALGSGIGLTSQSLTPWARTETSYVADSRSRLLLAQHAAPAGNGATWTVITAPTAELLARYMGTATSASYWRQLDGRIATFDPTASNLTVIPAQQGYFIKTAPLSPGNFRLIAAGWLSSYLEYYVLALVSLSLFLGMATYAVVRRSGVKP